MMRCYGVVPSPMCGVVQLSAVFVWSASTRDGDSDPSAQLFAAINAKRVQAVLYDTTQLALL